jgi:SAM-dependent MidA family methyltransferase
MATSAAVIFGNELLDAFPVHRVGWDASVREWFEWAVAADGSGFAWTRLPLPKSLEALLLRWLAVGTDWGEAELAALIETLPDGFILELSPAAEAWWSAAAQALSRGWLVAFDYGFAAGEQVRPERTHGTLRAYRGHTVNDDLLASPGEQDLTAHVNFAVLQAAGEAAGLRTVELSSQERFLTRVAAELPGGWTAADTRQLRTLVHPGHLGRAFRVLVQERA